VPDVSASTAIARYDGPVLLVHGDQDSVVPVAHLRRLGDAARKARTGDPDAAPVETMIVPGGKHSWLYEIPDYRRAVARMLTIACGGPLDPDEAGEIAAATPAVRIPDAETRFAAMEEVHGGLRTLAQVALPGATRPQPVGAPAAGSGGTAIDPAPTVAPARLATEP